VALLDAGPRLAEDGVHVVPPGDDPRPHGGAVDGRVLAQAGVLAVGVLVEPGGEGIEPEDGLVGVGGGHRPIVGPAATTCSCGATSRRLSEPFTGLDNGSSS